MSITKILYREGNGTPLQYSCLEHPMDRGAWWAAVHGVAKSRTRLSKFTFTFHFHVLEKEMTTHSSVFAWRIPGTGEPGGLPSMGLHRVGHDWSDLAARYYNYKLLVIWQIIICHTTSVTGLCTFVHTHSCFYSFIKLRIIYWTLHVLINYDIDIHVILIPNSFNPRP